MFSQGICIPVPGEGNMTISLTFNLGNVHRLHRLQIHVGDQPVGLVEHRDMTRSAVANPPDKRIAAAPNFAHAVGDLMDSSGLHKKVHAITRAGTRIMIELTFDATAMLLHRLRPSHPAGIRVIHVLAKAFLLTGEAGLQPIAEQTRLTRKVNAFMI